MLLTFYIAMKRVYQNRLRMVIGRSSSNRKIHTFWEGFLYQLEGKQIGNGNSLESLNK